MAEPQIKWDDTVDTSALQKQPQRALPAIPAVAAPVASDRPNAPSNSVPNTTTPTVDSQIKWDATPDVSALQQPQQAQAQSGNPDATGQPTTNYLDKGLNAIGDVAQGIGSAALKTGVDLYNIDHDVVHALLPQKWAEKVIPDQQVANVNAGLRPDTETHGFLQGTGAFAENLFELFAGDAALKGLPWIERAEKILKNYKAAKALAESSPRVAKALELGSKLLSENARMGAVQAGQTYVQTGDVGEAAKAGTGAALTGALVGHLLPVRVKADGTEILVRATTENPTTLRRMAEFLADKPMLQEFEIKQTQPAARAAIKELATASGGNVLDAVETQRGVSLMNKVMDASVPTSEKQIAYNNYSAFMNKRILFNPEDFSAAAKEVKAELQSFYSEVDNKFPGKDGSGVSEFKKAQSAEEKAAKDFDVVAQKQAVNNQRQMFDTVHGKGAYDVQRNAWRQMRAMEDVGEALARNKVMKPTPNNLLDPNVVDPKIIDGKALRETVADLYRHGTLKDAGIPDDTALQLQKLGDILERGRLQMEKGGTKHPIVAKTIGYPTGKMLGWLMTTPEALHYYTKVLAASTGGQATQGMSNVDTTGLAQAAKSAGANFYYHPDEGLKPTPAQNEPPAEQQ